MTKFVRTIESFFEKYIEGFFNKNFSSSLQPVELAKQLAKEMENQRTVGVTHVYVPNSFRVYINPLDYQRLAAYSQTIGSEIASYLYKQAREFGYRMSGSPKVDLLLDEGLGKGKFRIVSEFTEQPDEMNEDENSGSDQSFDTRVFSRFEQVGESVRPKVQATLKVIEGLDVGLTIDVGFQRTNMGRREGNELPLTDMNTSRLHAFITWEEDRHILHDAKSLNGTFINNHRITRKSLHNGDKIKVGNTVILYEVN